MAELTGTRRALLMAAAGLALAPRAFAEQDVLLQKPAALPGSWFDPRNRPTAAVTINGQGPFRFLVDTAATRTVIRDVTASRLGLPVDGSVTVMGMTGSAQMPLASVDELACGVVRKRGLRLAVLAGPIGAACDGILGADAFAGRRVQFDMRNRQVKVLPSVALARASQLPRMMLRDGVLPEVGGQVGDVRVRMVIDTGAECSVANMPLSQALLAQHPSLGRVPDATVHGLTGELMQGEGILLPRIQIDRIGLRGTAAVAADVQVFRLWGLADKPALIVGADIIAAVGRMVVDYGSGDFQLRAMGDPAPGLPRAFA